MDKLHSRSGYLSYLTSNATPDVSVVTKQHWHIFLLLLCIVTAIQSDFLHNVRAPIVAVYIVKLSPYQTRSSEQNKSLFSYCIRFYFLIYLVWSRGSSVGVVTRRRIGRLSSQGSITGRGERLLTFLLHPYQRVKCRSSASN